MRRVLLAGILLSVWPGLAAAQLGSYMQYDWTVEVAGTRFGLQQVMQEGGYFDHTHIHLGWTGCDVGLSAPLLLVAMICAFAAGLVALHWSSRQSRKLPVS